VIFFENKKIIKEKQNREREKSSKCFEKTWSKWKRKEKKLENSKEEEERKQIM